MHFLPDVWVECDVCRGARFNAETLTVKFRDKSIADVLAMPIGQAHELFANIPRIRAILATLVAVGLDYLTLGQAAATLSGGEAQRVKLAAELARPQTGRTLYILDEPTTGLHFDDIRKLLKVLQSLVEQGNTVVVIEHNLDVIKTADWLIDIGPEAGALGGRIVVDGTPEEVVAQFGTPPQGDGSLRSYTAELLAPLIREGTRAGREIFDVKAAAEKRAGDLDYRQVGRNAKMPWQVDGRKWHTTDRVSSRGRPTQWEGDALAFVVDELAKWEQLSPPNWGDRSVVEIGSSSLPTWFLHALTGDEWLLTLNFRTPRGTFRQLALNETLNITPLDEIDEIEVYGRGDRVRVSNTKGPWQEVAVTVHWLKEIDTPAFREFLRKAVTSYLGRADTKGSSPLDFMPWKLLGRKWHLSRKGFPGSKRVVWDTATLDQLFELLLAQGNSITAEWTNKSVVYFRNNGSTDAFAAVHTKRREGIDLVLTVPTGKFALGRIATLGRERGITPARPGVEEIKLRFDKAAQIADEGLKALLGQIASL